MDTKTYRTFGENLYAQRMKRNYSQAHLANAANVNVSAVSHYECDRRSPTVKTLVKFCVALGVKPAVLVQVPTDGS